MRARYFLLVLVPVWLVVRGATASEAVFSADGAKLWLLPASQEEERSLWEITTKNWEAKKKPLRGLGEDEFPEAVSIDEKGGLLVASNQAVYVVTERLGRLRGKRLATVPKSPENKYPPMVDGLSCVTHAGSAPVGTIFLSLRASGDQPLYLIKPGTESFKPVFVRRLSELTTVPKVSAGGRMVYGGNSDLWVGYLEEWDDDDNERAGALGGSRLAPLALLNTDSANSGSMGVVDIAVVGADAYVALGGRHQGALVKVPLPAEDRYKNGQGSHPSLTESLAVMRTALDKASIIEEEKIESVDALAARTAGGTGLFYRVYTYGTDRGEFHWKFIVPGKVPVVVGKESR